MHLKTFKCKCILQVKNFIIHSATVPLHILKQSIVYRCKVSAWEIMQIEVLLPRNAIRGFSYNLQSATNCK